MERSVHGYFNLIAMTTGKSLMRQSRPQHAVSDAGRLSVCDGEGRTPRGDGYVMPLGFVWISESADRADAEGWAAGEPEGPWGQDPLPSSATANCWNPILTQQGEGLEAERHSHAVYLGKVLFRVLRKCRGNRAWTRGFELSHMTPEDTRVVSSFRRDSGFWRARAVTQNKRSFTETWGHSHSEGAGCARLCVCVFAEAHIPMCLSCIILIYCLFFLNKSAFLQINFL